jgi:hypothetical protein
MGRGGLLMSARAAVKIVRGEEVRRLSAAAWIDIGAAVWYASAVTVSLVVDRPIHRRHERAAQSRRSYMAGLYRRFRTVPADEQCSPPAGPPCPRPTEQPPAQPDLQDPVVEAAEAPGERGENSLEPCRHPSPVG